MNRFLKKILFYGGLLFILLNLLALGSFWSLKKSNFYKPSFVYNQENLDLDYIILGSSMGLTTLDTKQIDAATGMSGLNLSMDDSALPTHYLMLKHFLNNGGQVKKCILAVTPWDLANESPVLGNNDHRFMPFIFEKDINYHFAELSNDFFAPLKTSQYIPLYGLGYYNTELFYPSLMAFAKPKYSNRFDDRGNYVYPDLGKSLNVKTPKVSDYQFNNPYLEKIQLLCKENRIDFILYQSPMLNQHQITSNTYQMINHSALLGQEATYFYDDIHVNRKGRVLATNELIKEIL